MPTYSGPGNLWFLMSEVIEPMYIFKTNILRHRHWFWLWLRLLIALPMHMPIPRMLLWYLPSPLVVRFLDPVIGSTLPVSPIQLQTHHRARVAAFVGIVKLRHGWTEADLQPERPEDLVYQHIGTFEIVGCEEVKLRLARMWINMTAVVSEVAAYVIIWVSLSILCCTEFTHHSASHRPLALERGWSCTVVDVWDQATGSSRLAVRCP